MNFTRLGSLPKNSLTHCLPQVIQPGARKGDMTFEFKNGAVATLNLAEGQPRVVFTEVPCQPGSHTYYAAQCLEAAAEGRDFSIAPLWNDQYLIRFSVAEMRDFAKWIRENTPAAAGKYVVAFVPASSDPF